MKDRLYGPLVAVVIFCLVGLVALLGWAFYTSAMPLFIWFLLVIFTVILIFFAYVIIQEIAQDLKKQDAWGLFNE